MIKLLLEMVKYMCTFKIYKNFKNLEKTCQIPVATLLVFALLFIALTFYTHHYKLKFLK